MLSAAQFVLEPTGRAPALRPELRVAPEPASTLAAWALQLLQELDHGVVVLQTTGCVLAMNQRARTELQRSGLFQCADGQVRCVSDSQREAFTSAVDAARHRGLRRLLLLRQASGEPFSLAVVPLGSAHSGSAQPVALLVQRPQCCEPLSLHWFAKHHQLTAAELEVLRALSAGERPKCVAEQLGITLHTVRTHISAIRAKTATPSIGQLLQELARLPPLVSSLRSAC